MIKIVFELRWKFFLQVLTVEQLFKHKVASVVFMGMGEPLLNLQGVLAAHNSFNKVTIHYMIIIMGLVFIILSEDDV
jgi:adenine C2-methylase RlmN of 23S rRNA A2503 and tRNA A37